MLLMEMRESIKFYFGTKAETLESLKNILIQDVLCAQYYFSVGHWANNKKKILDHILNIYRNKNLVVRSSAKNEDSINNSMAGYYHSVIDIKSNKSCLIKAIDQVICSYEKKNEEDQVLIQPYVSNSIISGVILTRDLDTGAEYYVINYDDFSGRTDTVTAGAESKEIFVYKNGIKSLKSHRFKKLIDVVSEIELATDCDHLDIEFCITEKNDIYILQVRRIAAKDKWNNYCGKQLHMLLPNVRALIEKASININGIAGSRTILGDMPDWNPAEIIGTSPKPLALSLYKELITDEVWSEARTKLGYKKLGKTPLLIDIYGKPYIDVRKSLNSFLPENISPFSEEILVNAQLDILKNNREYHDKIEFNVAITCCDFDYWKQAGKYEQLGVSYDVINEHYKNIQALTKNAIEHGIDDIRKQIEKTIKCRHLYDDETNIYVKLRKLIDICKENGTIPFSILARHAFIAVSFLKSIVNNGVMEQERAEQFMNSIQTISKEFVIDMSKITDAIKGNDEILKKYGHLRPGTYDIASCRYDEDPELFFCSTVGTVTEGEGFTLKDSEKAGIKQLLIKFNYSLSAEELLLYIAAAIEAREKAKFEFTRVVSEILKILSEWGESNSISRDKLCFVKINDFLSMYEKGSDCIFSYIEKGMAEHALTRVIKLPELIFSKKDVDVIRVPLSKPTFITSKSITAKIKNLSLTVDYKIEGCIIVIEAADPGFDWIFSHNISGLITKFGGVNSHMAIRCAEFGLPAAIGCGERIFSEIENVCIIELNCDSRNIKVIS